MKKFAVLVIGLAGVILLLLLGKKSSVPQVVPIAPADTTNAGSLQPAASVKQREKINDTGSPSATLHLPSSSGATNSTVSTTASTASTPALPPLTVLDNCRVVIHNYAARFGENPVGNNAEITAALKGSNPKQVNLLRDDAGLRVNEQGELLDGYGNPFFFHQVSGQLMEIRSAGKDGRLWTYDDQVTR
jgi:hypothetical protein